MLSLTGEREMAFLINVGFCNMVLLDALGSVVSWWHCFRVECWSMWRSENILLWRIIVLPVVIGTQWVVVVNLDRYTLLHNL